MRPSRGSDFTGGPAKRRLATSRQLDGWGGGERAAGGVTPPASRAHAVQRRRSEKSPIAPNPAPAQQSLPRPHHHTTAT